MRKSLVLASLVITCTSMMAMDTQYFIGAGAERGSMDIKTSGSDGYSGKIDSSDIGVLLKAGVILNNAHRISLSYNKLSDNVTDDTLNTQIDKTSILGSYDYLIPINNEFRLYTGFHAGDTKVQVEDIWDKVSFSGLAYGMQIGAIYDITKNVEFELGLGYTKYNVNRTEDDNWYKLELDKSTSTFAGINYKF